MNAPQLDATVLIVDDDVVVARSFERTLKGAGCRVVVSDNAEDALRELDRTRPDALIVDLRMPFIDGLGLLYRIRSREAHQHLPVLLVTGDSALSDEILKDLSRLGARLRYKPITPSELLAEARILLNAV